MSDQFKTGFQDPKGITHKNLHNEGFYAEGTSVPANGTAGYGAGCLFQLMGGSAGANLYINNGSVTSCLFQALVLPGVNLAGLLATAAEINRTSQVSARLITAITTLAVTQALHEGRTILLSLLAGFTSTLPASTGSGSVYRFAIGIVNTSNSYIISAAGSDVFSGSLQVTTPGSTYATANIGETFATTSKQTINLNGTSKGGSTIGDWLEVQDIQAGVWSVRGAVTSTTTPVTPFT